MVKLVALLEQVDDKFSYGARDGDVAFWLSMAEEQIREARGHLLVGRKDKAIDEIADLFHLSWSAMHKLGVDPEERVRERIRRRILPRVEEIITKYSDLIPEESEGVPR